MSMREKMARAVGRRKFNEWRTTQQAMSLGVLSPETVDELFNEVWVKDAGGLQSEAFLDADAALDALMDPTDGMINETDADSWAHDPNGPRQHWENMIRAAKEGK